MPTSDVRISVGRTGTPRALPEIEIADIFERGSWQGIGLMESEMQRGRPSGVIHVMASLIVMLAGVSPVYAEWRCSYERHYQCDEAGTCVRDETDAHVVIDDALFQYSRCAPECRDVRVELKRDFFGSTYAAEAIGLAFNRSRSGEFNEVTVNAKNDVTTFGFGFCKWQ